MRGEGEGTVRGEGEGTVKSQDLHMYMNMITHVPSHLGEGGFIADQLQREEGGVVVVNEVA